MLTATADALRVLLIEDDPDDYELTRASLDEIEDTHYTLDWVTGFDEGLRAVAEASHDICLLDNRLGAHSGIDLLEACNPLGTPFPVIILTGVANRLVDEQAMVAGAADFLVKSHLRPDLLERTMRYAVERFRLQSDLERMAKYDTLTGLANRALFKDFLAGAMARAGRGDRHLALMFLDLDHFKRINDTLGHGAGDALLVELAARLKHCVRGGDLVARLGGDEFAIIIDDIRSPENASRVARNVLDSINRPCTVAGHEFHAEGSIGIAIHPGSGNSSDELINAADTAMYEAKRNGRNTYRFFSKTMQEAAIRAARIERELAADVAAGNIGYHLQPQIDARNGQVVGMEVLARWGEQPPPVFIPIAERSGLITRLFDQLIHSACTRFSLWRNDGLVAPTTRISFNISAVQLRSTALVDTVSSVLDVSGLPPEVLELELTETSVMEDPEVAVAVLESIAALNVRIVTDDFGTGYSSLTYLSQLPICALKIDYCFVKDIDVDHQNETIVKATIGLSRSLGIDVVAEGVETESQERFLMNNGCHVMQGWLYSRARSPDDIEKMLGSGELRCAKVDAHPGSGRRLTNEAGVPGAHDDFTILVVDDDPEDSSLLNEAFVESQIAVALHFVENGEQAMEYLKQCSNFDGVVKPPRPQLILLDLNMPRKDGRDVLAEIKGDASLRQIPVVIFSTSTAPEDVSKSYQLGVNSYISKPFTFEGLMKVVHAIDNYWCSLVVLPK